MTLNATCQPRSRRQHPAPTWSLITSPVPSPGERMCNSFLVISQLICWYFLNNIVYHQNFIFSWGEGITSAMGSNVVDNCTPLLMNDSTTKPHGCMSQLGSGLCYNTTSNNIKKRSLKRAHNRLRLQGWTWYKGKIWTDPHHQKPSPTPEDPMPSPPPEHLPKRRLVMFCWNGGSLSSARYHELLHWLHLQRIDVGSDLRNPLEYGC